MSRSGGGPREIAVPISILASLRHELEAEAGTLPTVRALHSAGYHAGLAAAETVQEQSGGKAFATSQDDFFVGIHDYFAKRGWGKLTHSVVHDAVGMLSSPDWAEVAEGELDPDASCCFSTGFLSGLFSQLAGGPVAVLEIECRTRGGSTCDFAFGSEGAIHELYGQLLEGVDLDGALTAL